MNYMKRVVGVGIVVIFAVYMMIASVVEVWADSLKRLDASKEMKISVQEAYGKLPLSFEANQGQTDSEVKFLSRGIGYNLFLTATEAVLRLNGSSATDRPAQFGMGKSSEINTAVLRMEIVRGNPDVEVTGMEALPGKANYFIGDDPAEWRVDVPLWARVAYHDVYPGVDLVYHGRQGEIEYDFIVEPGANPAVITLGFTGVHEMKVDEEGNLLLKIDGGQVVQRAPNIYQTIDGTREKISGGFVLRGKNEVGFQVAAYDVNEPLVIDPALTYSTYLGGAGSEAGEGVVVDAYGKAYVAGWTDSVNFPKKNPSQAANAGDVDVFVTKFDPTGSLLVYSTYLGGGGGDFGRSIAIDGSRNAYVTGDTTSADFPRKSPFRDALSGWSDAFVAKLDASGKALLYSTYLGGSNLDVGRGITVDSSGRSYVTGDTTSLDFPTKKPFQAVFGGGNGDAFVTKLDPAKGGGGSLVYSTYLGGSGGETGNSAAVDGAGQAYVTGETTSVDFPVVKPLQAGFGGGPVDAFVTNLDASGSKVVFSTYLGGNNIDSGQGIAVDSTWNVYVAGVTFSNNFPTMAPFQNAIAAGPDAFVTKITAGGAPLIYSTYLGGFLADMASAIAVDGFGNAYVAGLTNSVWAGAPPVGGFPLVAATQAVNNGGFDAFATKFTAMGGVAFSSYLGGNQNDIALGVAFDNCGDAYVTGRTFSGNFPLAGGVVAPFQIALAGWNDAFVTKFQLNNPLGRIGLVSQQLQGIIIANPGTPLGARAEQTMTLIQVAEKELCNGLLKRSPAAVALVEAVSVLEETVNEGLLSPTLGIDLMLELTDAILELAVEMLTLAVAEDLDSTAIQEAQQALAEGDALKFAGAFLSAAQSYAFGLTIVEDEVLSTACTGLDLTGLRNRVENMSLPAGWKTSLLSKIDAAIDAMERGDLNTAENQLRAFLNEVSAQRGKKLSSEQADCLLAAVGSLRSTLGE